MFYLGIDPSLRCTGICLVDDKGLYIESTRISSKNDLVIPKRIYKIFNDIGKILKKYKKEHTDLRVSMELPLSKMFYGEVLTMVQTCLWLHLVKNKIPFVCITPLQLQGFMKDKEPSFNYSMKSTGTCKLTKKFFNDEGFSIYCKKTLKTLQKDESDAFMVAKLGFKFWQFYDLYKKDKDISKIFTEKEIELFSSKELRKTNKFVKRYKGIIHNKGLEYFTF